MTKVHSFPSFSFMIIFFFYHFTTALAQSPAQSPTSVPLVQSPPGKPRHSVAPTNVTEILEKAGGFSVFIRLLRSTDVITQIENDLNASNSVTVLAPTNGGFSALKPGTLNELSPQQKAQLVDFHVLPTFISLQNFQTLTNPIRTQAGNTKGFPLSVATDGNSVNISTGIVNTTISGTVYSDNQLAVYRVDSVLLPIAIFSPEKAVSPAPAPAPLALKPKKASSGSGSTATATPSSDSSSSSPSTKPSSVSPSGLEGPFVAADNSNTSGGTTAVGKSVMPFVIAVVVANFSFMNWF